MSLPLVLLFLLISPLLFLSYYYLNKTLWAPLKTKKHFQKQGVIGPDYRPIFGNSAEVRRRLITEAESRPISGVTHDIAHRVIPHYTAWSTLYGKNFLYWFGSKPRLAVADPGMIKEILMDSDGYFGKIKFNPSSKILLGDGVVGLEGEKWRVHRSITTHAFNMDRVKVRS